MVLMHNASLAEVPFDFNEVMYSPAGSAYTEALDMVSGTVHNARVKAAKT
jgi:hypothetical protein